MQASVPVRVHRSSRGAASLALAAVSTGAALCVPAAALAHGRSEVQPHVAGAVHDPALPAAPSVWNLPWSDDLFIWIPLVASLLLYAIGFARLQRTASHAWWREAASFAVGWIFLAIALVSPLHPWGSLLFSAHMAQHEILMVVAAPLLVLGRPLVPFAQALSPDALRVLGRTARSGAFAWIRAAWRVVKTPLAAWAVHAVALWIWHIPRLFEATLTSELVHFVQHASFFGTAVLFWWALLRKRPGTAGYGAAILYLFTTAAHGGALGALLTVAKRSFYPAYAETAPAWGLTPLEDQQLGGLIMWVPAGTIYAIAALALLVAWLNESSARADRRLEAGGSASVEGSMP